MSGKLLGCRLLPVLLLAVLCGSAFGQARGRSSRWTNSGNLPWVVVKGDLKDFTGRNDSIVADFNTRDEAREVAKQLNKEEKNWTRWTYNYRKRRKSDGGAGSTAIISPGSGGRRTPRGGGTPPPAPPTTVAGTWSGSEGGNKVQFVFSSSSKTVRAYDQSGEWSGTWRMITSNTVFIELTVPNKIRYSGTISADGKTIKGSVRNVGTGKTWKFEVKRIPSRNPPR